MAGTGSLAFWPRCLQAKRKNFQKLSFIVVTDTHLGYRNQVHAVRLWEKTAAEIGKAHGDLVLHLGDVVDGGRESQYPVYVAVRKTIGKPVHEIPGKRVSTVDSTTHIEPVDDNRRSWLSVNQSSRKGVMIGERGKN